MAGRERGRTGPSAALGVVGVLCAGVLAGCGSASPSSPPTGVDGLVVPTPSVTPGDFVRGVDNPWLPLRPGAQWTYTAVEEETGETGPGDDDGAARVVVRVLPGTTQVDGVAATAVETTGPSSSRTTGPSPVQVDYYAQDRAGNVWWFGRRGEWTAGSDGAEAGLAMPAHPRVGDGWREAYRPGVVADRATVLTVDAAFSVPEGAFDHLLTLETSSDLSPGIVHEQSYARGVGLVREYAVDGPAEVLQLLSGP